MMTTALMRPLQSPDPQALRVTIYLNDQPLLVPAHANLAAALMAEGLRTFRHNPAGGAPRAPYCMMGACFECLVEVDGIPNTQSCLTRVRDGMQVRTTPPDFTAAVASAPTTTASTVTVTTAAERA